MGSKIPPKERKLDQAPTGRGACKACKDPFTEGSLRVARQKNSAFHDGFETTYYHANCHHASGGHGIKGLEMIENLGEARVEDQLVLLDKMGVKVSKNAALGDQATKCNALWALSDELAAQCKPKDMAEFMEANALKVIRLTKKKNKYQMAYEVADALLFGKPGPCPICDGAGALRSVYPLTEKEPAVQCHGMSIGGGARCEFGKGDGLQGKPFGTGGVKRERVMIPDSLSGKKTFFKGYQLPSAVQKLPLSVGGAPVAAPAAAPAAAAGGKKGKKNKKGEGGAAAAAAAPKRQKLTGNEEALKVHAEAPKGKIYISPDGTEAYNVTLSEVNLESGINKFYILQLLQTKTGFTFWTKWGRVGEKAVKNSYSKKSMEGEMTHLHDDVKPAIKEFEKKFKDKSGNLWKDRANFKQVGLMNMVLMDGSDNTAGGGKPLARATSKSKAAAAAAGAAAKKAKRPVSKLEPRVADFIRKIFDEQMMAESLKKQNIDLDKMPLGSLSRSQVSKGYELLCKIQALLEQQANYAPVSSRSRTAGGAAGGDDDDGDDDGGVVDLSVEEVIDPSDEIAVMRNRAQIKSLSQEFYMNIPHVFPEGAPPAYIDNPDELRRKTDLIQSLEQLQDAASMTAEADVTEPSEDEHYKSMNCPLTAVDKTSEEWKLIEQYVRNSHGGKASRNTGNSLEQNETCELVDAFIAVRPEDTANYTTDAKLLANRQLLWHGSGIGNWGSILRTGLRIAPPEAPSTGWLFGKGLYFANAIQKSAFYCAMDHTPDTDVGVLALLEVALGEAMMLKKATGGTQHSDKRCAQKELGHTWAVGKTFPTPPHPQLPDGCVVPNGVLKRDVKRLGPAKADKLDGSGSVEYDEYICYKKNQAKIRYIVTVKFGQKGAADSYDLT